jgi:hypothetical protein
MKFKHAETMMIKTACEPNARTVLENDIVDVRMHVSPCFQSLRHQENLYTTTITTITTITAATTNQSKQLSFGRQANQAIARIDSGEVYDVLALRSDATINVHFHAQKRKESNQMIGCVFPPDTHVWTNTKRQVILPILGIFSTIRPVDHAEDSSTRANK